MLPLHRGPAAHVVVMLALLGCSSPHPAASAAGATTPAAAPPPATQQSDGSGRITLDGDDLGVKRHAVLREQPGPEGSAKGRRVLEIVELTPPGELTPEGAGGWLFSSFPAECNFVAPGGRIVPHPDRALAAELGRGLEASPPSVTAMIAALPRLHRYESRAALLTRAAAITPLASDAVLAIVDVACAGSAGPLLAPAPGKRAVGETSTGLRDILLSLARRPDLTGASADRIAAACARMGWPDGEAAVLLALVERDAATTQALISATAHVGNSTSQRDVLLALAKARGDGADADAIAAACAMIGWPDGEASVLLTLVARGGARTKSIVLATGHVGNSTGQRDVLLALAKARGDGADADAIVAACPMIGWPDGEASVLLTLVGKGGASTAAILPAAMHVGNSTSERDVLLALAKARGASAKDADPIAAACAGIGWPDGEAAVLLTLVGTGGASTEAIVGATKHVGNSTDQRDVLVALAKARGASAQDAGRIAAACAEIGWPDGEATVLLTLITAGGASTESIVGATKHVGNSTDQRDVLVALAKARGATAQDADRIAAACADIGWPDGEATVLRTLAVKGGASAAAIVLATKHVGNSTDQRDVLLALARREKLAIGDADRVAAACEMIGWPDGEVEVLLALVGHASPGALEAAAHRVGSDAGERRVLEAIGRGER